MKQKVIGWAIALFVVWFVIKNPAGAAASAKHLLGGLEAAASSVGDFLARVSQ